MEDERGKKTVGLAILLMGNACAHRGRCSRTAECLGAASLQAGAEHRIPCFKIGGSIRFDPLAVALWLRMKMARPPLAMLRKENTGRRLEVCS